MDTIFMNSENSETPKTHVLTLKLTNKLDLRIGKIGYCFIKSQYLSHVKNIKSIYNNNNLKISAPTRNDKFELPHGSYSVSDI